MRRIYADGRINLKESCQEYLEYLLEDMKKYGKDAIVDVMVTITPDKRVIHTQYDLTKYETFRSHLFKHEGYEQMPMYMLEWFYRYEQRFLQ